MSKDRLSIAFLAAISLITLSDILEDIYHGKTLDHVLTEGAVFLIAVLGVFFLVKENILVRKENIGLRVDLEKTNADFQLYRKDSDKLLAGLGEVIDKQMSRWAFTPAEKEVGLLLLKGFSFKEVASYRNTTERTARQQSLEIYKKSGLGGRAEFSGFFLEDLLLPMKTDETK